MPPGVLVCPAMLSRTVEDLKIAGRLFVKPGLPVSLVFFVTSKCNLLCRHCFYWEELNNGKDEFTLEEIERISLSLPNLLTVSLTGGEPYLRPDLPEVAAALERNSGARNIQIPSTGYRKSTWSEPSGSTSCGKPGWPPVSPWMAPPKSTMKSSKTQRS